MVRCLFFSTLASDLSSKAALATKATRSPLASRPLDMLYFTFFLVSQLDPPFYNVLIYSKSHIPASMLIDFQAFYPPSIVPSFISNIPVWYFNMSKDPLVGGAMGYLGNTSELGWFQSFLVLEL
jgi:hypothetical protein